MMRQPFSKLQYTLWIPYCAHTNNAAMLHAVDTAPADDAASALA